MKHLNLLIAFFAAMITLTGCDAIAGIFKAGVWSGVIIVVVIIAVIIFVFSKLSGKK